MTLFRIRGNRAVILFQVALLIASIALVDWKVEENVPLGFLYLLPMAIAGSAFTRPQIVLLAALCTFLAEAFDSFHWSLQLGIPRDVLYFSAFSGIGLFVYQVVLGRQESASQIQTVQNEIRARRDAEEQLKFLIESSPVAILTADSEGIVLLANDAAHRLFAASSGGLPGKSVSGYLPSLANVPSLDAGHHSFRTVMQCKGHREDGEVFIADVWFSTYRTSVGPRLAAMVVDTSEDLRDREESSLHQLLASSRILVGAVSHEIRNVCGAIAVVHENLSRDGVLSQNNDFQALGTLVLALEQIASMKLRETIDQAAIVDLESLLEELKIVIGPSFREQEIDVLWEVQSGIPRVWADRQSLMQVFLNVVKNSERAMTETAGPRRLSIQAGIHQQRVRILIGDTGCGVKAPELLFRPFQPQAKAAGLGLYLSRALMRSFKGDLRYEPRPDGSCFVVELTPVLAPSDEN